MHSSRWHFASALVLGLLTVGAAQAQETGFPVRNAGDLAALCSAKSPDPRFAAKLNFCFGYAQGVLSSEQERAQANQPGARKFCMPSPAPSRAATMDGYAKWIHATPANANLPAADSMMKSSIASK